MASRILLGYELGTGKPVDMALHHLVVTGMTGESGKTTTIEGLLTRGKLTGLVFRTKRGELGFEHAHEIPPFFSEEGLTEWRSLEGLLSATLNEKVQREPGVRAAIIGLCSGATTLDQVYKRNNALLKSSKGFMRDVREKIKAYLDLVLPQLANLRLSSKLTLQRDQLNVMNLEGLSDEMQNLVIFASTEFVHRFEKNVILVIPEAPKFIPQDRGSPCKVAFERYIREGRAIGNYLWIDSQDLRGVDKKYLRHCDNWILGRQRFMLEVESTLDAIPLPKADKPKPEEIQRLGIGQFFACLHNDVTKVYVQPSWLDSEAARKVAITGIPPTPKQEAIAQPIPKFEGQDIRIQGNPLVDMWDRLDTRLKYVEKTIVSIAHQDPAEAPVVELTDVQTTYNLVHKQANQTLTTTSRDGQIVYIMLNDLEGKASTTREISQAMAEHGWAADPEQVRLGMLRLVKERALVVREGDTYRLGKYTKVSIT
jgi:hypothetical protein